MTQLAIKSTSTFEGPKLRLLPRTGVGGRRGSHLELAARSGRTAFGGPATAPRPILVAGGSATDREAVLRDLRSSMPRSTSFEEAGALWEVVARAAQSCMVIFSGELEDMPAESLMQLLAKRHPELPVVSLDPPSPLRRDRPNG
jgi:hypothetical protein